MWYAVRWTMRMFDCPQYVQKTLLPSSMQHGIERTLCASRPAAVVVDACRQHLTEQQVSAKKVPTNIRQHIPKIWKGQRQIAFHLLSVSISFHVSSILSLFHNVPILRLPVAVPIAVSYTHKTAKPPSAYCIPTFSLKP